ncbi:hypothetical protein QJQ45_001324 [Haematococcus lacustris]|nr:hypothetical protein QJQ45_001324 [Haematococcus lacustris]
MAWKTEQIEKVQERIKKAEDWIKVLKALPVKDEFESVSLVETEKRLILMRKEEAVYLQVEVLEEAEEVARRPSEAQCLTPSQRQRFTQQQYQQPGLQQQSCRRLPDVPAWLEKLKISQLLYYEQYISQAG